MTLPLMRIPPRALDPARVFRMASVDDRETRRGRSAGTANLMSQPHAGDRAARAAPYLAASAALAFSQSDRNWTIPDVVSGWWTIC
jgi:hypothetical protein